MANEFEIIGTVVEVKPIESFGTKGFRKRAVVLLTREHASWPEHVQVELQGENVDNPPALGKATVRGWITGRKGNDGRVWNTLKVRDWQQDKAAPKADEPKPVPVAAGKSDEDDGGLPF